ncbi:MAG: penicillin-binding protein 1C, partial [Giesbergeria sp.]
RTLVRTAVRFGPAPGSPLPLEAARSEWFVPGTQQGIFAMDIVAGGALSTVVKGQKHLKDRGQPATTAGGAAPLSAVHIATPVSGTIIALDPDIPPLRQRLQFEAGGPAAGMPLRWRMDGKPVGRGVQWAWLPWPGRHVVQLTDARGTVLDEVRIEVRGAGVRGPVPGAP